LADWPSRSTINPVRGGISEAAITSAHVLANVGIWNSGHFTPKMYPATRLSPRPAVVAGVSVTLETTKTKK